MRKLTIEEIREYVNNNSRCILKSSEYISSSKPLLFICECGEEFQTSLNSFKGRKNREPKRHCDKCGVAKRIEKKSYSEEEIRSMVEEKTDKEYILKEISWRETANGRKRVLLIEHTKCHKEYEVTIDNWNYGKRCRECGILERAKLARLDECTLKEKVETMGEYKFINSFTREIDGVIYREKTYITIQHLSCGEVFTKSLGEWTTTPKCPICSSKYSVSSLHAILSTLFKRYYPNSVNEYDIGFKGDRGGISRYDLFVPKLNGIDTLFEFQSRYHDNKKEFDLRKRRFAEEKGYKLVALDHRTTDIQKVIKEYFNLDHVPLWVYEEIEKFKK